jgi:hypothetical protein
MEAVKSGNQYVGDSFVSVTAASVNLYHYFNQISS